MDTQQDEGIPGITVIEGDVIDAPPPILAGGLVKFDPLKARIDELRPKALAIYDLTKTADNKEARRVRAELVSLRNRLPEVFTEWNRGVRDAQAAMQKVRDERIAEVAGLEKPLDDAITAHDAKRAAEKKARDEAAAAQAEVIRERIAVIASLPARAVGKSVADIDSLISALDASPITEERFGESLATAQSLVASSLALLRDLRAKTQATEDAAAALAAERAALELERQALASAQERARREDEERARLRAEEEARQAAADAAARQAEADRQAAEHELQERERRAQQDAFQAERDAANAKALAAQQETAELRRQLSVQNNASAPAQPAQAAINSGAEDAVQHGETGHQVRAWPADAQSAVVGVCDAGEAEAAADAAADDVPATAPAAGAGEGAPEELRRTGYFRLQAADHDDIAGIDGGAAGEPTPGQAAPAAGTTVAPRPSDTLILRTLAQAFEVSDAEVLDWIEDMDLFALRSQYPVA